MKRTLLFTAFLILSFTVVNAQNANPAFPKNINANIQDAFKKSEKNTANAAPIKPNASSSAYQAIKKLDEVKKINWEQYKQGSNSSRAIDTVYVGLIPQDTLWITGTYNHNGPIFVFNDGVLIFVNATATNSGDLIVFEHGRVLGFSSSITFPQQYFYQRSMLVVQNGLAYFEDCSFNYSGMQHGLTVTDSAVVGMKNVIQKDWTTAGASGYGGIYINGLNLGGEYILTDNSTTSFVNVDTLLLWHKLPQTAVINFAFPKGDTVRNYDFNNTITGVSGIGYNTHVDSSHTVMWGLMPVNGSDATISNSTIRAIGAWFERGDNATVSGIYNDSLYTNTVAPMTDRNIHLINTYVQTWSFYAFDSSTVNISNCLLGEVGTLQKSQVISQQFILDGSGGYFWASDTSVTFASDVLVYSTARSERNGLFFLAYSNMPFSTPASVNTSIFVSVQNTLPLDPVPYEGSIMWLQNIESPSTAHADSLIQVKGSTWIDQGPQGHWMDYGSYSLYYQIYGGSSWTNIVKDSVKEIRHNTLGKWNTAGLTPGTYILRLSVINNVADTVDAFKTVTILPGIATGLNNNETLSTAIFPNPASDQLAVYFSENNPSTEIKIYNLLGAIELNTTAKGLQTNIDIADLPTGAHIIEIQSGDKINRQRFIKQ